MKRWMEPDGWGRYASTSLHRRRATTGLLVASLVSLAVPLSPPCFGEDKPAVLAGGQEPSTRLESQSGTLPSSLVFLRKLGLDFGGGALVPIGSYANTYQIGLTSGLGLGYSVLPWLRPSLRFEVANLGPRSASTLVAVQGGLGIGVSLPLGERVHFGLGATGGLGVFVLTDADKRQEQYPLFGYGLDADLSISLGPEMDLIANGGASFYSPLAFGSGLAILEPLVVEAEAGLAIRYRFGRTERLSRPGADPRRFDASLPFALRLIDLKPIFPVFHSYYDSNPFGTVEIMNGEDRPVRDLSVWFESSEYMNRPKLCATLPVVEPGQTVKVPLYALFDEDLLSVTENGSIDSQVRVAYRLLGVERESVLPLSLMLFHRNAMNWVDDRRAAAFASPNDPAVLWFSKFVAGVVADRSRPGLNKAIQLGMGVFEAERLFGINYVVDPSSPYVDNVSDETSADYLQYPHQTLAFRGGDCDDLSILYTSLLESLGVKTAFITIPGHIYAGFQLGLPELEAREAVYDPELLIYRDGIAWLPVEITMVKDGFVKAWRVGAKEWYDNVKSGEARLYPVEEAWKLYPSAGIQNPSARFALPDEASFMQAFDTAADRFVVRQIDGEIRRIALDPAKPQSPEDENKLGLVYGRNGMLKEAWTHFGLSAKGGFQRAWTNLANVAFLRRDWELAAKYYEYAAKLDPLDDSALLGHARSCYELEKFAISDADYAKLRARNPVLAAKFSYLASMLGGEGRAWSLSDRLSSVAWSEPGVAQTVAIAPAAPPAPLAASTPVPKQAIQTETVKKPAPVVAPAPAPAPASAPAPVPAASPAPSAPSETSGLPAALPAAQAGIPVVVPSPAALPAPVPAPVAAPASAQEPASVAAPASASATPAAPVPETAPLLAPGQTGAPLSTPAPLSEPTRDADSAPESAPAPAGAPDSASPPAIASAPFSASPSVPLSIQEVEPESKPEPMPLAAEAGPAEAGNSAASATESTGAMTEASVPPSEPSGMAGLEDRPAPEAALAALPPQSDAAPASEGALPDLGAAPTTEAAMPDLGATRAEPGLADAALPGSVGAATAEDVLPPEIAATPEDKDIAAAAAAAEKARLAMAPSAATPEAVTIVTNAPIVIPPPSRPRPAEPDIAIVTGQPEPAPQGIPGPAPAVAAPAIPQDTASPADSVVPLAPSAAVAEVMEEAGPPAATVPEPTPRTAVEEAPPAVEPASIAAVTEPATQSIIEPFVRPESVEPPAEPVPVEPAAEPAGIAEAPVEPAVPEEAAREPEVPTDARPALSDGSLAIESPPATGEVAASPAAEPAVAYAEAMVEPAGAEDTVVAPAESFSETGTDEVTVAAGPAIESPPATGGEPSEPLPLAGVAETASADSLEVGPRTPIAGADTEVMEGDVAIAIADGFEDFKVALGSWSGDETKFAQLSENEYYAKLVSPMAAGDKVIRYSFRARSTGHAWVGYGLHVAARDSVTHRGYGEGRSWLVWLTSDPVHLGDDALHVQLYRSDDDINLSRVSDVVIPGSAFQAHAIEIVIDPSQGTIVATVDGTERLRQTGLPELAGGEYIAFRALDKTEIDSFRAEELK